MTRICGESWRRRWAKFAITGEADRFGRTSYAQKLAMLTG
jgi:hypothetical protein